MSLKNLNFDKSIIGFDGKETGEGQLGQVLARVLASEASEDKLEFIKYAGWVKQLWAKEPLSLDKSDLDKLKSLVEKTKGLNAWLKALLFDVLEDDGVAAKGKKDEEGGHTPIPPIGPKGKK